MERSFKIEIDRFIPWQPEDELEARISKNWAFTESKFSNFVEEKDESRFKLLFNKHFTKIVLAIRRSPTLKIFAKKLFRFVPKRARIGIAGITENQMTNAIFSSPALNKVNHNSLELGFGICTSSAAKVSVVISVYNNYELTIECLRSLQIAALEIDLEVILIDDCSTEFSSQVFANLRGVRYMRLGVNEGYTKATNIGASFAQAPFILLLNNDTYVLPGCIPQLLEIMENDAANAIVGATLLNSDYTVQESGSQIFSDGVIENLGFHMNVNDPRVGFLKEVDYCSAAAILVRKEFWIKKSGFDERYAPAYFEDTDLCLSAWQLGHRVVLAPRAYVIHIRGASYGINNRNSELMQINKERFLDRWATELTSHWENNGANRFESSRVSKGIVVIVDYLLPSFSRDSGSIRTIRLIESLMSLGYHVCLSGLRNESTILDLANFQNMGIEVYSNPDALIAGLHQRKSRVKNVWLVRESVIATCFSQFSKAFPGADFISDLLDLDYMRNDKDLVISKNQIKITKNSQCVVLVSPFEKRILQKEVPQSRIIDCWKNFPIQKADNSFASRSGLIFVGGFGHKPNRDGMLWFLDNVLPILRTLNFKEEISVVGTNISPEDFQLMADSGIQVLGNVKNLTGLYGQSKLAMAPLISGRGLKGKVAEALSFGIPVIASSVAVEGFDVNNQECIKVADNPADFAAAILILSTQPKEWLQAHSSATKYIEEFFSKDVFRNKVVEVLNSAGKSNSVNSVAPFGEIDNGRNFEIDKEIFVVRDLRTQSLFRTKPFLELGNSLYKRSYIEKNRIKRNRIQKIATLTIEKDEFGSIQFINKAGIGSIDYFGLLVQQDKQDIYGHWILDILPKFLILQKIYGSEIFLFTTKIPKDFVFDLLKVFKLDPKLLKSVDNLEGRIINLVDTSETREFDLIDIDALDSLINETKGYSHWDGIERSRKIFVSRKNVLKAGIDSRTLSNRDEIEDHFLHLGFEIVHPEDLKIEEQISIFAKADIIAGEAGSGMHNSIFMPDNALVINLQSAQQRHLIQSSVSRVNNGRCIYVWGDSDYESWDSNFQIDVEVLKKLEDII